jgi:hypothetical protein
VVAQVDDAAVGGQGGGECVDLASRLMPRPAGPNSAQCVDGVVCVLGGGLGVPLERGEPGPLDVQVEASPGLVLAELSELLQRGGGVDRVGEVEPGGGCVSLEDDTGPVAAKYRWAAD